MSRSRPDRSRSIQFGAANAYRARGAPERWRGLVIGLVLGGLMLMLLVSVNLETSLLEAGLLLAASAALAAVPVTRRIVWFVSGAGAVLVALCVLTPILEPLERALDVSEPPSKSDAIVILGGGYGCDSRELMGSSLGRLVRGLELWRQGFARTVTISDTDPGYFGERCADFAASSRRIIGRLYPDGGPEILELSRMQTTRTEAEAVARLARERGWTQVIVVTSPTHTRRSRATFLEAGVKPVMVSAYEPRFDSALRDPADRFASLGAILREVAGLVKYGLNGWL